MIKRLFVNWKTTGAGVLLVTSAVIDIAFMFSEWKPVSKLEVQATIISLITGIGLIAAGDADKSQSKEDAAKDRAEDRSDTKQWLRGKQDAEGSERANPPR